MKFNPGRLKERVDIVRRKDKINELSQRVQEIETIRSTFADVVDVRGNKYYDAKKLVPEITHFVYIRYTKAPVEQDMLIRHKGKMYEVKSCIDMQGPKLQYEIQCVEKVKKVAG